MKQGQDNQQWIFWVLLFNVSQKLEKYGLDKLEAVDGLLGHLGKLGVIVINIDNGENG